MTADSISVASCTAEETPQINPPISWLLAVKSEGSVVGVGSAAVDPPCSLTIYRISLGFPSGIDQADRTVRKQRAELVPGPLECAQNAGLIEGMRAKAHLSARLWVMDSADPARSEPRRRLGGTSPLYLAK